MERGRKRGKEEKPEKAKQAIALSYDPDEEAPRVDVMGPGSRRMSPGQLER